MGIETLSLRPLRPNLKEFKWLRVFGPQCRVSIAMTGFFLLPLPVVSFLLLPFHSRQL